MTPTRGAAAILAIAFLLSPCLAAFSSAEDGAVPEPIVRGIHRYDFQEGEGQRNISESWAVEMTRDNFIILIGAADYTERGERQVSYSQNINFYIGDKFYIAMFCIDHVTVLAGNQTIKVPLSRCGGFAVSHTPVEYAGEEPVLDCEIAFSDIRVYNDTRNSTFDLTISHHITCGWNETRVKVGANFDFADMVLYDGAVELVSGAPFSMEVCYVMQLTAELENPEFPCDNTVGPQSMTNDSLLYNLTVGGIPYELSRLTMDDYFLDVKADPPGTSRETCYSSMAMAGPQTGPGSYNRKAAVVIHGFPSLNYKWTDGISCDPQLTIFHDGVGTGSGSTVLIVAAVTCAIVVVAVAALAWRMRKT